MAYWACQNNSEIQKFSFSVFGFSESVLKLNLKTLVLKPQKNRFSVRRHSITMRTIKNFLWHSFDLTIFDLAILRLPCSKTIFLSCVRECISYGNFEYFLAWKRVRCSLVWKSKLFVSSSIKSLSYLKNQNQTEI